MFCMLLFLQFFVQPLHAILDGRSAPIVLENRYTFTNYEWAKGFVSFRGGFDLPTNGTVFIALDTTAEVEANINLNGGTIFLKNDIYLAPGTQFLGNGFIVGDSSAITFEDTLTITSCLKLTGTVILQSNYYGMIDFPSGGSLDVRNLDGLRFNHCTIVDRGSSILTTLTYPRSFEIDQCIVAAGAENSVTQWFNPTIKFIGDSRLLVGDLFKLNTILLDDFSRLNIASQSAVQLKKLLLPYRQSSISLVNSYLDFISTDTLDITIGTTAAIQGRLILDGPSIIASSTGNKLRIPHSVSVEFPSGARLAIDRCSIAIE